VTKEDLELIDALVWAGCLSRPAAREVASQATPGRIATYIIEKGFAPLIAPPQVIIERLAKYEAAASVTGRCECCLGTCEAGMLEVDHRIWNSVPPETD
jgi:hypothetical protein